jgi:membrane protein
MFKLLPDTPVRWSDVWVGALCTAVLFELGKLLVGLYLGHAGLASACGAAGSFVVVLVWVYYSAQILFFGAESTQVIARRRAPLATGRG